MLEKSDSKVGSDLGQCQTDTLLKSLFRKSPRQISKNIYSKWFTLFIGKFQSFWIDAVVQEGRDFIQDAHTILRRKNLEIREHSSFLNLLNINIFKGTMKICFLLILVGDV